MGHGKGAEGESLHVKGATIGQEGGELQHPKEVEVEVQVVVIDVAVISGVGEPEGRHQVK